MGEDTVSLSSLAEIAITLTGFTGLIASLRRRPIARWHPRVRYNFWMTLCHGVCTFALALLPTLLSDVGAVDWRIPHAVWLLAVAVVAIAAIVCNRRLAQAGSPPTVRSTWWTSWLLTVVAIGVTGAALFGAWGGPSAATYHFGVAIWLVLGLISFIATLLYPMD
ncbi:hypothetical protein M2650_09550 [Luteimonas sp. SX5]|uniref:DUF2306 domain-containing protein n=1 Tax=Luteimonas galliterrae TaxID=2940486 RepID=A0ABT0MJR4_9GAMM|nr:hypothetical protein [Luteimonas galliterrae]MCL1634873.1 hypothetical protein [Luteimonas galliterrae]